MSCIWQEVPAGGWRARVLPPGRTLPGSELGLEGVALHGLGMAGPGAEGGAALLVQPGVWVRVNGQPVLGGLRLLEHKDEVLVEETRFFLSLESAPTVVLFQPGAGRMPTCPICRGPIREGNQAVQCPGCGRWFHQGDVGGGRPAKPCWTYAPTCRFCGHPTSFTAEAVWQPEREECRG